MILTYNKKELLDKISKIEIKRVGNTVTTLYDGRVLKSIDVTNIYEVFNIVSFLKEKIDIIESNFNIHKYELVIKGGIQSLKLISDEVTIGDTVFYKTFFILNSSDKSRKLNFTMGLSSRDFYIVGKNAGISKKHFNGITNAANLESYNINVEKFDEQINLISKLLDHKVSFSNLRNIILGDSDISKINHRKLDMFKNILRYKILTLTNEQKSFLAKRSDTIDVVPKEVDFYIDAFIAFKLYMKIFKEQDPHIVRNETNRIMYITQSATRNSVLESLGI